VSRNNVVVGPAERVDGLVDFRGFETGTQLRLTNGLGAGFAQGETRGPNRGRTL
jgi:hypothetical protein